MSSSERSNPLIFIIIALVVLGISWWGISTLSKAKPADSRQGGGQGQGGPPPTNVVLAPVTKVISQKTQHVTGTLRARQRSQIAAREAGARGYKMPFFNFQLARGANLLESMDSLKAKVAEFNAPGGLLEQTALLSLRAELARDYLSLRHLDEEISQLNDTLKLRSENETLVGARVREGDTTDIDSARARSQTETGRAEIHRLQQRRDELENAVAVLAGTNPSTFQIGNAAPYAPQPSRAEFPPTSCAGAPTFSLASAASPPPPRPSASPSAITSRASPSALGPDSLV